MSNLGTIESLPENLRQVRERVSLAAVRSGRNPAGITLIAVTKTVDVERIQAVVREGVLDLGENRVQEAKAKVGCVPGLVRWHLIGSLQTNKAKLAVEMFDLIHSLDRPALAEVLAERASEAGRVVRSLVQVNVSGEASKHGLAPGEVPEFIRWASRLKGLSLEGLMTMAPLTGDPEEARPYFRGLRELRDRISALNVPGVTMRYLSMGMSGDFEVAVEEGANLIRVGSVIFGARN